MDQSRTLSGLCAELRSRTVLFHSNPERDNQLIHSLAALVQCLLLELDDSLPDGEDAIGMSEQIRHYGQQLMNIMYPTIEIDPAFGMPCLGKVSDWFQKEEAASGNKT